MPESGGPAAGPRLRGMADVPAEIDALAMARSRERIARRWAEADRLRAEIEAAGWRVIDTGTAYELVPAHPPTIVGES